LTRLAQRSKTIDRNAPLAVLPDLRDWMAEGDLAHFVIHAVQRLPLSAFAVNYKRCGDEQYPPHMMLALLIDCYANGIFSSRRIERATYREIPVRYLTGNTQPDHDTICTFRRLRSRST
jgi:transposase